MENKVKTRRRKDRKTSKLYHFRFETELKDKFVKVAEEAGYNTTEALEVLMQKAIDGLLPMKQEVIVKLLLDAGQKIVNLASENLTSTAEVNKTIKKAINQYEEKKKKENMD